MVLAEIFDSNSPVFTWIVLPLLIFVARIGDQSIGTLRLIFVSKGFRFLAPFLGFFEVIIWLAAVGQIMQHLDNVLCYIAYGAGFATGNYIGIVLDEKLSIGTVLIRIFPTKDTTELIKYLSEGNYGVTLMDAEGGRGKVKIVMSIINRKDIRNYVSIINQYNPNAFYTIEEIKSVNKGVFKPEKRRTIFDLSAYKLQKSK